MCYPESLPTGAELEYDAQLEQLHAVLSVAETLYLAQTSFRHQVKLNRLLQQDDTARPPLMYWPAHDYRLEVSGADLPRQAYSYAYSIEKPNTPPYDWLMIKGLKDTPKPFEASSANVLAIKVDTVKGLTALCLEPGGQDFMSLLYVPGLSYRLEPRAELPRAMPTPRIVRPDGWRTTPTPMREKVPPLPIKRRASA